MKNNKGKERFKPIKFENKIENNFSKAKGAKESDLELSRVDIFVEKKNEIIKQVLRERTVN